MTMIRMIAQLLPFLSLICFQLTCGCKFGTDCEYPCHCGDSLPCHPDTGYCSNGCDDGDPAGNFTRGHWSGTACQIGNVAYGKPAEQRQMIVHYDAVHAVDGSYDPVLENMHCSYVQWSRGAWWKVDLVNHYRIFSVTIYNANTDQERISDIKIYIMAEEDDDDTEDSRCGSTGSSMEPFKTVTCQRSIVGRYVELRRSGHLQLCEVMVTGYQYNFERNSPEVATIGGNTNGAPCVFPFQYKGVTYNQCIGFNYEELWCSTTANYGRDEKWSECLDCPLGYFGPACISSCNCDQPCDHITGVCPGDCLTSWVGDDCQVAIPSIDAPTISREGESLTIGGAITVDDDRIVLLRVLIEIKRSNITDWAGQVHEVQAVDYLYTYVLSVDVGVDYDLRVTPFFLIDGEVFEGTTSPVVSSVAATPTNASSSHGRILGIMIALVFVIIIICVVIGILVWRRHRVKPAEWNDSNKENPYEHPMAPRIPLPPLPLGAAARRPQLSVVSEEEEEDKHAEKQGKDATDGSDLADASVPMLEFPIYENGQGNAIDVHILLTYVDELKKVPNGFLTEYEQIPRQQLGTTVEANKPGNRSKNRFRDISAYDHSRVILKRGEGESDYINASHISGYDRPFERAEEDEQSDIAVVVETEESELYENLRLAENDGSADVREADPWRDYINIARLKREDRLSSRKISRPSRRDRSRIDRPSSLYVNSVMMKATANNFTDETVKNYIAAQGPTWNTREDFLEMIWQQNVNRIVMVTRLVEKGKAKCECYWPGDEEPLRIGCFCVDHLQTDDYADYIIRDLIITKHDERRRVRHFHFTGWPDQGLPDYATSLIDFREKVRSYDAEAQGPMLVHCSAGIGRTGTFIALDYLLDQAKYEGQVDVVDFVTQMRLARRSMVQNLDQYVFVYDGLLEATISKETAINCARMKKVYRALHADNPESGKSEIQDQYELLAALRPHSTTRYTQEGTKPENIKKNRTLAIIPRDHRRVSLKPTGEWTNTYINAVFVDGYRNKMSYILTQMPLANTVTDFWRMISDHSIHSVVVLSQPPPEEIEEEETVTSWPDLNESRLQAGPVRIEYETSYCVPNSEHLIISEFSLTREDDDHEQKMDVRQYKIDWQAGGETISQITAISETVDLVGRWQQETRKKPIVIQCRDGTGLSGLYCAACFLMEKIRMDHEVDVFLAVKQIRAARPPVVGDIDQYKFLHALALEHIETFNS